MANEQNCIQCGKEISLQTSYDFGGLCSSCSNTIMTLLESKGGNITPFLKILRFEQLLGAAYLTIDEAMSIIEHISSYYSDFDHVFKYQISALSKKSTLLFKDLRNWIYADTLADQNRYIEDNSLIPIIQDLFVIFTDISTYIQELKDSQPPYNLNRFLFTLESVLFSSRSEKFKFKKHSVPK